MYGNVMSYMVKLLRAWFFFVRGLLGAIFGAKKTLVARKPYEVWYRWFTRGGEFCIEYEMLVPGEKPLHIRDRSETAYPPIDIERATERFRGYLENRKAGAH